MSTSRKVAVRLLAVVSLLSFNFMFVFVAAEAAGVISVEPVASADDPLPSDAARKGAAAPDETVHVAGALAVMTIGATGVGALLIRPQRPGSSYHVLSAAIGLLSVLPIVGNPDNYGGQAGVVDPAFAVLAVPPLLAGVAAAPWRARATARVSRPMLILAAIGALPLVVYGIDQALMQRNTYPPVADPHHQAHWFAMAVFAFVVALVVATASIRATGWRLAAAVAALGVLAVAIASIADGDAASSFGRIGGVAAAIWAAAVLGFVLTSRDSMREAAT